MAVALYTRPTYMVFAHADSSPADARQWEWQWLWLWLCFKRLLWKNDNTTSTSTACRKQRMSTAVVRYVDAGTVTARIASRHDHSKRGSNIDMQIPLPTKEQYGAMTMFAGRAPAERCHLNHEDYSHVLNRLSDLGSNSKTGPGNKTRHDPSRNLHMPACSMQIHSSESFTRMTPATTQPHGDYVSEMTSTIDDLPMPKPTSQNENSKQCLHFLSVLTEMKAREVPRISSTAIASAKFNHG
ncbi:hypothetical protein AC578_3766 [Pseudocercospora eumusae]|uniref:Uncharacterized protein n=1 Tax=Pseudocercospora eumusae TaxID=321146 RepID=A0A139HAK4_9PEZI|nr:hypothetical protein AC578_3766 [Pseudocercospora eumusae]